VLRLPKAKLEGQISGAMAKGAKLVARAVGGLMGNIISGLSTFVYKHVLGSIGRIVSQQARSAWNDGIGFIVPAVIVDIFIPTLIGAVGFLAGGPAGAAVGALASYFVLILGEHFLNGVIKKWA